jgi:hypothetical protein
LGLKIFGLKIFGLKIFGLKNIRTKKYSDKIVYSELCTKFYSQCTYISDSYGQNNYV